MNLLMPGFHDCPGRPQDSERTIEKMGSKQPFSIVPVGVIALIFIGLSIPAIQLALFAFSSAQPGSSSTTLIEVNKGEAQTEIIKKLVTHGIISDGKFFLWLGKITRQWKGIKAGEYKLSPSMSPIEIFSVITSGISASHPLTVREGENIYEIADDLHLKGMSTRESFLELCKNSAFIQTLGYFSEKTQPKDLEGYLFPDTYFFDRTLTEENVIRQMIKRFSSRWGQKEEARAAELRMTRHQVITLASMIEKETGAPEERPIISAVFHNRLKKGMKLQSDPTTIYGMWSRYEGKIHKRDLFEKNNYNTYMISGLPAGPIGNPGVEAIRAALYPADSPYYYFVSHNNGTHQFSRTIEEHNQAVKKYQLDPKAREGRSWRDLNKKPASVSR